MLARAPDCPPQSISLFGVLMYFDRVGLLRSKDYLLLNATDVDWNIRERIQFNLLAPKTAYHAYRLTIRGRVESIQKTIIIITI